MRRKAQELIAAGYRIINDVPLRLARLNGNEGYVFELRDPVEEEFELVYHGRAKELVEILQRNK